MLTLLICFKKPFLELLQGKLQPSFVPNYPACELCSLYLQNLHICLTLCLQLLSKRVQLNKSWYICSIEYHEE